MNSAALHEKLAAAGIPVKSVSVDGDTAKLVYEASTTPEQKTQAEAILAAFDKSGGMVVAQDQRAADLAFLSAQWGKMTAIEKALARVCGVQEP